MEPQRTRTFNNSDQCFIGDEVVKGQFKELRDKEILCSLHEMVLNFHY